MFQTADGIQCNSSHAQSHSSWAEHGSHPSQDGQVERHHCVLTLTVLLLRVNGPVVSLNEITFSFATKSKWPHSLTEWNRFHKLPRAGLKTVNTMHSGSLMSNWMQHTNASFKENPTVSQVCEQPWVKQKGMKFYTGFCPCLPVVLFFCCGLSW